MILLLVSSLKGFIMEQQVKVQRPGYRIDNRANVRKTTSWYKNQQCTNKVQEPTHLKEIKMFYKPTLPKEPPPYESAWHLLPTATLKKFSESPNVATEFNDSRDIVSLTVNEQDGVYHSVYRRLKHKRNANYHTEVWECVLAKFTDTNKVLKKYWSITRDEQLYARIDQEMNITRQKRTRHT